MNALKQTNPTDDSKAKEWAAYQANKDKPVVDAPKKRI